MTTTFERVAVQVYTKTGSNRLFWLDADGVEHEIPVNQAYDGRACVPILHSADWPFTSADWVCLANSNAWATTLPVAILEYPLLKHVGKIEWFCPGKYWNGLGTAQDLEFELVIDGVASGHVFSWPQNSACDSGSLLRFKATLAIHGAVGGTTQYTIDAELVIIDSTGADVVRSSKTLIAVIDGSNESTSSRNLAWRFRKNNATSPQTRIEILSPSCLQTIHLIGAQK